MDSQESTRHARKLQEKNTNMLFLSNLLVLNKPLNNGGWTSLVILNAIPQNNTGTF
jgi:hypothetical protein